MKVGDLVMLSAYGKKLHGLKTIGRKELGIIVGKRRNGFIIRWSEYSKGSWHRETYDPLHFRNELRFAK